MSENTQSIIAQLESNSNGMTATAIAHALGFSKGERIKKDLAELVSNGSIVIDKSTRYELYKMGTKKAVAKAEAAKVTVVEGDKVSEKLPEADTHETDGYVVSSIKFNGKLMKKISLPTGKPIRVENDEKLVVVNGEPKYVVKSAEDIITCIRKYAVDNNLNVFTVNDIKQNRKISNDKDIMIKDDHIMFISIKKHNKAA